MLTLSATPIPRTLQLSLTGVRDLSIIGTPPVDRLAIRTFVSEFDPISIREALLREHYRGGQSFYVVPRIKDLPEVEDFLKEQLPELSYVVAHGQMAAGELDDRMNAFYDGKYDILLATTIVESGLDIPTANTMVVHRADMFGLAQLYQIRGRVGRSKVRAYAYITTKPRMKLTQTAEKRLRVLGSLDTLGAGFTLASQDLDIRGAGNLLGEEQSGHMRDVGYELYQSMLEEAIAKIKSGELEGLSAADDQWAPQINLGVPVLIPDYYVPDLDVRLGLYRRLSGLSTKVELEGFAAELIDRFGKLPREVNTLLLVVRIKSMCKRAGIAKLDGGPKGATIQFHNDKFASPQGLVEFIQDQKGLAKIKDNKIVVRRDWAKESDKIKGAYAIARDLAAKADFLLENFRPGTLERWNLGYDALSRLNAGLIMIRVSGFGQTGPYSSRAGFGAVGEAMGGLRYVCGDPATPPSRMGISIGDSLAATFACLGAMMALHHRERTGHGQVVDSAIYEAVLNMMESLITEYDKADYIRERQGSITATR